MSEIVRSSSSPGGVTTVAGGGTGATTPEGASQNLQTDFVVASLAALKALTTFGRAVTTQCRTTSGDQGGGTWVFQTGDQSANVTADPQSGLWAAPDSASTGASGAWLRQYAELTLRMFGATGLGLVSDSAMVSAAILTCNALSIPVVEGTGGVYLLTASVAMKSNVWLRCDGNTFTEFRATANITMFTFNGTNVGAPLLNAKLTGCLIRGNGLGNAAAVGISSRWTNRCEFSDIRFFGHYAAYKGLDAWQFRVRNNWVDGGGTDQSAIGYWLLSGGDDPNYNNTHLFTNSNAQGVSLYGCRIENGAGSIFTNCQWIDGVHGLYGGDPTTPGALQFMFFNGCQVDTSSQDGVLWSKGTATSVGDISMTDTWAGQVTAAAYANIRLVHMVGVKLASTYCANAAHNLILDGCTGINVTGFMGVDYDAFNLGNQGIYVADSIGCVIAGISEIPDAGAGSPGAGLYETGTSTQNSYSGLYLEEGYSLVAGTSTSKIRGVTGLAGGLADYDITLGNFLNDAAAALGGVAIGQEYRNGSIKMVRVA